MKNILTYIFTSTLIVVLGVSLVSGWSWLVASSEDVLDHTKWNELVSLVDSKIDTVEQKVARIGIVSQTNLNGSTSYRKISLWSASIDTIGISKNGDDINLPAGIYSFTLDLWTTSSAQRGNLGVAAYVKGSLYSESHGSYIRSMSGHNEVSNVFTDVFELTSPWTLSFYWKRLAAAWTITTDASHTRIIIRKLK